MNNLEQNEIENEHLIEIDNKPWVDKYYALVRLYDNPDFKTVILDGYFTERAVNGVSMLANMGTVVRGDRPQIMEELVAISRLQDYFNTIKNLSGVDAASEYDDEDEG